MSIFRIATWNVNSLRVRLPQVLAWLGDVKPDILALQEIKMPDSDFPLQAIEEAGYRAVFSGQRTYNGVAILSKLPAEELVMDLPGLEDPQRRVLGATINGVRVLNLYIPNGESVGSEKYAYKLNWLKHLDEYLRQQQEIYPQMVILGDFNIAPEDKDVHDPVAWVGNVLVSEPERDAFRGMVKLGFVDCFRLHTPDEKVFSWWDYRLNAFKRGMGLRIDHIMANKALASGCINCYIDKVPRGWERPSDHTPVVAEFKF